MNPFLTSAFGDEAGPLLNDQLAAIKNSQIGGLDVRSVENVNVLSLADDALQLIRKRCKDENIRIQSVGSPINKVRLDTETKVREIDKLQKAIYAAKVLETKRIRIFTPEVSPEEFKIKSSEIVNLIGEMASIAAKADVLLLHENDARYFGAFPENAKLLFDELKSANLKAAFDFGNSVMIGYDPFSAWFPWILPYLDTLHMKDATENPLTFVACGEGDGKITQVLQWLVQEGWNGCLTLEPHLKAAGPLGGYSGPELFSYAAEKMREILIRAGGQPETENQAR